MTLADITTSKELEAKLRLAYEELEIRTAGTIAKNAGNNSGSEES